MGKVVARRLTFEEYLKMPETMRRYEIIDGVMRMTPAPSGRHQLVAFRLARILADFVEARGLGVVLMAPFDVILSREPLRTRQPDILFLSKERGGEPEKVLELPFLEVGPDLVVEVLSPSEGGAELEEKILDYCRIGVRECWLVRPEEGVVEVLRLSECGPERIGVFGRGEAARGEVLPGLEVSVDEIMGPRR